MPQYLISIVILIPINWQTTYFIIISIYIATYLHGTYRIYIYICTCTLAVYFQEFFTNPSGAKNSQGAQQNFHAFCKLYLINHIYIGASRGGVKVSGGCSCKSSVVAQSTCNWLIRPQAYCVGKDILFYEQGTASSGHCLTRRMLSIMTKTIELYHCTDKNTIIYNYYNY